MRRQRRPREAPSEERGEFQPSLSATPFGVRVRTSPASVRVIEAGARPI